MFKDFKKNNKGTTLLELTVAISIFSIAILSVVQIFSMSIEGQRNAVAAQNIQENMRYILEVMSKEIRMAKKDTNGDCDGLSAGDVFNFDTKLFLLNSNDDCVEYFLDNGRLKVRRYDRSTRNPDNSDFITPTIVNITNLNFAVKDLDIGQPRVTIVMDVEATGKDMHKNSIKIQTAISARYYE